MSISSNLKLQWWKENVSVILIEPSFKGVLAKMKIQKNWLYLIVYLKNIEYLMSKAVFKNSKINFYFLKYKTASKQSVYQL